MNEVVREQSSDEFVYGQDEMIWEDGRTVLESLLDEAKNFDNILCDFERYMAEAWSTNLSRPTNSGVSISLL